MYPIQKVTLLLLTLLYSASEFCQEDAYAANSKKQPANIYAVNGPKGVDPIVKVKGRAETKVLLHWAPFKGAVSHYVLERSTDGRNYQEAGVLFTGDWEEEPEYFYTDRFRRPYQGPLYYRLRVVGLEGSVI